MQSKDKIFRAEYDETGVRVYQAFCSEIADWALEHQKFGGPKFNPTRMTWIKPSFAWMLYRSGYGYKHGQKRILKMTLPHEALAVLLAKCQCKEGGGGTLGRVQWDPERDLLEPDAKRPLRPRKMLSRRAIQIGLKGKLSKFYVDKVTKIEEVSELAHKVFDLHSAISKVKSLKDKPSPGDLLTELPREREYLPLCSEEDLKKLGLA